MTATQQHRMFILVVFLASVITYANTLQHQFVHDDVAIVLKNSLIRDLRHIPEIFVSDYWKTEQWEIEERSGLYRPLVIASFAVNYAVDRLNPFGYHLFNLLIHSLNCILIYFIICFLTTRRPLAFLSAVIYALHPIHTEAVASIVGRSELLAALFVFLAWFLHLLNQNREMSSTRPFLLQTMSVLAYFFGLLCKENAITFLGILLLSDYCFHLKQDGFPRYRVLWRKYWGYLIVTCLYLVIRFQVVGTPGVPPQGRDYGLQPLWIDPSFLTSLFTMSKVFFYYIVKLVLPISLSPDYSYNSIPLSKSFWEKDVIIGFCLAIGLLILALYSVHKRPLVSFSILFFFLTASLISNLIVISGVLMADRLLYLPSFGICMCMASVLEQLRLYCTSSDTRQWCRPIPSIAIAVVMILYGWLTFNQNRIWRDNGMLWSHAVEKVPNSFLARLNYANFLASQGKDTEAIEEYKKSMNIRVDYALTHLNLGGVYTKNGRYLEAEGSYQHVLKLRPNSFRAYEELGFVYERQNKLPLAIQAYQSALRIKPQDATLHKKLAGIYERTDQIGEAVHEFRTVLSFSPADTATYINLGRLLMIRMDSLEDAEQCFKTVLQMNPQDVSALNWLGSLYLKKGQVPLAIDQFRRAIRVDSSNISIHSNLAVALDMNRQYSEAIGSYLEVLRSNPNDASLRAKLGRAYLNAGVYSDAISHLEYASQYFPNNSDLHLLLGISFYKKGEIEKARAEFLKTLRLDPKSVESAKYLQIISNR